MASMSGLPSLRPWASRACPAALLPSSITAFPPHVPRRRIRGHAGHPGQRPLRGPREGSGGFPAPPVSWRGCPCPDPDSNPGCAGSRDLDLSVLLSQLGGVDPPPPLQQGAQLPAGGPAAAPPANLHIYSTVGNLKQHVANVHGRGEWVACGVCAKTFKTRQYLQSHLLQQHGIRQRPAPLLPPCPQPLDPSHHMLPHESPSSSAQTSPFSPAYRPYHNQPPCAPPCPIRAGLLLLPQRHAQRPEPAPGPRPAAAG
ncbi:Protein abrupt [Penaeus vannamei]|uniref:Protein abrupt n=1 Tax=Penaeus vannamei TaxID=6689 RepID=A0A3R7QBC5_PENVA|nr:Protein abrupt [Penaeus vannamei]